MVGTLPTTCEAIVREQLTDNPDDVGRDGMEAIAAGGSIIAFIQIAAKTISAATDIVKRFKDAPEEFKHVARLLNQLQSELHLINNLQGTVGDDDLALLPNEIEELSKVLADAKKLIHEVQKACNNVKHNGKPKTTTRVLWVFHDQSKLKNVVSRLQQLRTGLQTILLLINIRIISLSRKAILMDSSPAITTTTTLVQDVANIRKAVKEFAQLGKTSDNVVFNGLVTRDPHDKNQFWKSMVFLDQPWLRFLGIEAVLSMYGNDYQTTYNFSGRYYLHRLVAFKLICLDLRMRRFPIAGLGLSFLSGGLSVKNVVPENSEIMTACKIGDIISVQELFKSRKASPNDVTPENSSPLRYAIENGSPELVKLILSSGADVNAPFGQYMTSPLEWAFASRKPEVARIFMSKGARVDHISAKGWTPAFNLFGYKWIHKTDGPCDEYLELLSATGFSEFDIQDIDGWSAMHRAAAYGTADDIIALVGRGSSVTLQTRLNWPPIRCAVRFQNVPTFQELVKHLHPTFVDERDIRGWTLLHEAASMGSSTMLHLILEHGADPHIVSEATSYMVPSGLENRQVTPADVAENRGPEAYMTFLEVLNLTVCQDTDDEETLYDVFWPAESKEAT